MNYALLSLNEFHWINCQWSVVSKDRFDFLSAGVKKYKGIYQNPRHIHGYACRRSRALSERFSQILMHQDLGTALRKKSLNLSLLFLFNRGILDAFQDRLAEVSGGRRW